MYLIALTVGMCLAYPVLLFLFSLFFKDTAPRIPDQSLRSVIVIAVLSVLVYFVSLSIPDRHFANRFLHAMGGGFLAFFICFLVVRDSKLQLPTFQFVVFSTLVVTALGVANELAEFFLQNYYHFLFAPDINDTWLDLLSNTVGIGLAAVTLAPFIGRTKKKAGASHRG